MNTAEMESMNEDKNCLASSLTLEFAKDTLEHNKAVQAAHLIFIISPHIEKIMDSKLK